MSTIDYAVDNYTIDELLSIINLDIDQLTTENVMKNTDEYIARFNNENNSTLSRFFQDIQTKLLQYENQLQQNKKPFPYQPDNKQTKEWYNYEALPQKNKVQKNKITDRFQKIQVYDNQHVPMKREQLGVNNVIDTKVAQDVLNPNLENVTTRFINLDSQFRQSTGGIDSISTDYTLDLSDPLTNVLSLRLYSIQIPYTWYTINKQYGNTCFWITNYSLSYKINIEPGNYSPTDFCIELNNAIKNAGFTGSFSDTTPTSYNANNGKISIQLNDYYDPTNTLLNTINTTTNFDITTNAYFTFFDLTGEKNCGLNCASQNFTFNNTLGWLMGFRLPITPIYSTGNIPISVLDLYGPKYLILVLDDYNQNHINNGLITITELSNKLALPTYYTPTLPLQCNSFLTPTNSQKQTVANLNNLTTETSNFLGINPLNTGKILEDKIQLSYKTSQTVLPTAPRTLTQAQIYTINQIIKNKERNTSYRGKAPTASDTFALLPIKHTGMKTGEMYVDFSGALQDNKRIYFGPVDIDRIHIKLLDDRGYIVDLQGSEWCITLISDNLYQY
jgi:hypothetical protein